MTHRVKIQGDLFHGRVPDGAVYVGRGAPGLKASRYRNPFSVKEHGLDGARQRFRAYLAEHPELVAAARTDLAGWDLACWCPTDSHWCHADDWLAIAAGETLSDPPVRR